MRVSTLVRKTQWIELLETFKELTVPKLESKQDIGLSSLELLSWEGVANLTNFLVKNLLNPLEC